MVETVKLETITCSTCSSIYSVAWRPSAQHDHGDYACEVCGALLFRNSHPAVPTFVLVARGAQHS